MKIPTIIFILLFFILPASASSDWWNSVTGDDTLNIQVPFGYSVNFTLNTSGIATTTWILDGATQIPTTQSFVIALNASHPHVITANGYDGGAILLSSVTWRALQVKKMSTPSQQITPLNTSAWDAILASMSGTSPNFMAFFSALMTPYTNVMDSLFFVFLYVLPLVVIWIRQEKAIIPVGLAIIFGFILAYSLPPSWIQPALVIVYITTIGLIYSMFKEK